MLKSTIGSLFKRWKLNTETNKPENFHRAICIFCLKLLKIKINSQKCKEHGSFWIKTVNWLIIGPISQVSKEKVFFIRWITDKLFWIKWKIILEHLIMMCQNYQLSKSNKCKNEIWIVFLYLSTHKKWIHLKTLFI